MRAIGFSTLLLSTVFLIQCGQGLNTQSTTPATQHNGVTQLSNVIFEVAATGSGNMGGVTGADALCNASLPTGVSSAKALLVDGSTRVACTSSNCATGGATEHVDWVLTANTTYYMSDGVTVFGTTDSIGLFNFPLTTAMNSTGNPVQTGMNGQTGSLWVAHGTCSAWTSTTGNESCGFDNATTDFAVLDLNGEGCTCAGTGRYIFCVEQ
jgi:hypothetical protein